VIVSIVVRGGIHPEAASVKVPSFHADEASNAVEEVGWTPMAASAIDFSRLLSGIPRGAWVAISQDHERVLAFGSDMRKVVEEAQRAGEPLPIIVRVPESTSCLVL
jgi:hypothetical protein